MVERREARYATNKHQNTSSDSDILHQLKWETLEDRRKAVRPVMMNQLANNIVNGNTEGTQIQPKVSSLNSKFQISSI